MSKSQMKLANRAWRNNTKELFWDKATPKHSHPGLRKGLQRPFGSKKAWKNFCRQMAAASVSVIEHDEMIEPYTNQEHADDSVREELDCW